MSPTSISAVAAEESGGRLALSIGAAARPIRVLLFVDNFDHGGSQGQLVELANRLVRDPLFDVWVGCLRRRGTLLDQLRVPAERVREYPLSRFYDLGGMWQITRLARDVARARIDVVHAFDFYAGVMCAAAAGWNHRVRLIVSRRYEQLSTRRRHRWGEWWSYRVADRIVTNSARVGDRIARDFRVPPARVAVIPNGVDLARFDAGGAETGIRHRRRAWCLGVVARLSADKGLDTMLQATERLVQRGCDVEVVLVGEGERRADLERQVREMRLEDRVTLLGAQADVRPWVSRWDVAVLPSHRGEGLPNAVLEYLAMGRPVVATRVGGVPEVLNDPSVGVLVSPGEPDELAAAIEALLHDPARRAALSVVARRRAEDYTMDGMVQATTRLYRELIQRPRFAPVRSDADEPRIQSN